MEEIIISSNLLNNPVVENVRQEMVNAGYTELKTVDEVEAAFAKKGTTLVLINSLCCSADRVARPAAAHAIHYSKRPDHLVTVFAGQDKEATEKAREYFTGYAPSSPSFALLKDGKICKMVERFEIKNGSAPEIVSKLQALFDQYCEEI